LVRLLCADCKEVASFSADLLPRRFLTNEIPKVHYLAKGCEKCFYTGYKGRKAIYEVIPIDRELSQLIRDKNLDTQDILKSKGIISLAENAFALLKRGDTSLQEIAPLLS
jgi:general secretion pathway protein E/type IV pilus assembly protein PilB